MDPNGGRHIAALLALALAACLLALATPTGAIFNCLTPGMFKLAKSATPMPYGPDRAHWYPQNGYQTGYPSFAGLGGASYAPASYGYPMQPTHMKRLLMGPKWRPGGGAAGTGLFGGLKSWAGWKSGQFYRPGIGYPTNYQQQQHFGHSAYSGVPIGELSVAPFTLPAGAVGAGDASWSPQPSSYANYQQQQQLAGLPIQQTTINAAGYDGFAPSVAPPPPPPPAPSARPQLDPYSQPTASAAAAAAAATAAIKGGAGAAMGGKLFSTTRKNLLLADGGYSAYDAHLMNNMSPVYVHSPASGMEQQQQQQQHYGYSYPDWYASSFDSPAKIGQQLLKMSNLQLRRQKLASGTKTGPTFVAGLSGGRLVAPNSSYNNNLATTTSRQGLFGQEPRFAGFGQVDLNSVDEVRLSCTFNEPLDQANHPIWVKFQYDPLAALARANSTTNSSTIRFDDATSATNNLDPVPDTFNCLKNQCRFKQVDSSKDTRYTFQHGKFKSTLVIRSPNADDFGFYRCSALTSGQPVETIYQIIRL